jgi:hypothetical protein
VHTLSLDRVSWAFALKLYIHLKSEKQRSTAMMMMFILVMLFNKLTQ